MRRHAMSLALLLLLAGGRGLAFIHKPLPFDEVLRESSHVCIGTIESVDVKKRIAVAAVERTLKGAREFRRIQMNIGAGPRDHADYLLPRLRPGQPFIIFYRRGGRDLASLVHAADTWFQLFGTDQGDRSKVWWRFTHIEVYMGRTYNGATPELLEITADVIAGRRTSPKVNLRVPKLDPKQAPRVAAMPAPAPAPADDGRDGLEAVDGWVVETDWARPAALSVTSSKERGKLMLLRSDGDAGKKVAVTLLHHVDLAEAEALVAEVDNASSRPLQIAVALGSAPDWQMYEAPAVAVPPKARAAPVRFALGKSHFKNAASEWKHSQALPKRTFDKVMLLVEGLPERGSVTFDRVRGAAAGGGFRRILDIPHPGGEARGIAWADIDGDEQLDLTLCCGGTVVMLGDRGAFRPAPPGMLPAIGAARSAAWADYNGDDHPDLLTSSFRLFTNAGGKLRDDSALIPAPRHRNPEGAGWIDYNGDGRPDILIANGEDGIRLYENAGKGPAWFRDVSEAAGLGPKGIGRGNGDFIAFADVDGDGYTDFLYNLGKGVMALNQGDGTFRLDTASGIDIRAANDNKLGVAFADFDNDGDLDLFVPSRGKPQLYRNNNDGTFTDVLAQAGALAGSPPESFAAAWGDVDLDGSLDLFVCHTKGGCRLYLADGKGGFTDATAAAGLSGLSPAFAASFADLDGDGDLDLVVNLDHRAVVLRNEMARAAGRGALRVRLHPRGGSVGAVVRVLDAKGKPMGLRELRGAEGCGGQACPVAHFGLPLGPHRVSAALTDGRLATKTVTISAQPMLLTLSEEDFQ